MLFILNFNFINIAFCDYAMRGQFGFQDASTSIMQGIINLHHHIFFFIIIVLIFVSYMMIKTYKVSVWKFKTTNLNIIKTASILFQTNNKTYSSYELFISAFYTIKDSFIKKLKLYYNLNISHGTLLEIIWTILPSLILLCIVGPSFALLFAMDAIADPDYSVKVVGHQWYWSYEYTDSFLEYNIRDILSVTSYNIWLNLNNVRDTLIGMDNDFMTYLKDYYLNLFIKSNTLNPAKIIMDYSFDSYMKATPDLVEGELRLLEVDNALYLPIYSKIRLDITSDDVMHAFAVPSLGIKIDAIPGRLNVIYLDILREGVFFGQCSELCGVNHGYMPIKIVAVNVKDFMTILTCGSIDSFPLLYSQTNLVDIFNYILTLNYKEIYTKI